MYDKNSMMPMIALQPAPPATKTRPENSPERDRKWECSTAEKQENPHIVEVAFTPANTPKRESSVKPPRRVPNAKRRSREFLTPAEVDSVIKAAEKVGRHGFRDSTLILIAYRHALRVSELVSLRWDQVDFNQALLHVKRLKNGNASTHPLHGPELRALRKLQRDYPNSPYVFTGERRGPLTASTIRKMVARAGVEAGLDLSIHPHMLRHAAGYKLANDGQDTRAIQHYLGHRNICHTVVYTNLSPDRFKNFWQD
jgi:type 1 fimbriae regulatory protein FimB/type 1 fimbriae regulatory protein FimE